MATPCPTSPTSSEGVGQRKRPGFVDQSDLSDLSDRKTQGGGQNSICLSALAARWRFQLEHDEAEAAALVEHYAAPVGPELPQPDSVAAGLAHGFWAHRRGTSE